MMGHVDFFVHLVSMETLINDFMQYIIIGIYFACSMILTHVTIKL